jgi:hypothetical protein
MSRYAYDGKTRYVSLLLLSMGLATGCGTRVAATRVGGAPAAMTTSQAPVAPRAQSLDLGANDDPRTSALEALRPYGVEIDTLVVRVLESSIAKCMSSKSLDYSAPPAQTATRPVASSRNGYGLVAPSTAEAAARGYRVVTPESRGPGEYGDRSATWVREFGICEDTAKALLPKLAARDIYNSMITNMLNLAEAQLNSDTAVGAARTNWISCVAAAGLRVRSPSELRKRFDFAAPVSDEEKRVASIDVGCDEKVGATEASIVSMHVPEAAWMRANAAQVDNLRAATALDVATIWALAKASGVV